MRLKNMNDSFNFEFTEKKIYISVFAYFFFIDCDFA